jgi:N-acetylmuramoyl-L-alanine amidase
MRSKRNLVLSAIIAASIIGGIFVYSQTLKAQTPTLYWGSSGPDVSRVQSRLSDWGYYKGPIDGVVGGKTADAIKRFQAKNGLPPDGVVGKSTWAALGYNVASQPAYQPSRGVSNSDDVNLLAHLVQGEAGSEPYIGKVAVAAVILNRTESDKFPHTIAGVVYQPNAFESITNGVANAQPSDESIKAAEDAVNGWDPSQGALFFWNPSKPVSPWIWTRQIITEIGGHVFGL